MTEVKFAKADFERLTTKIDNYYIQGILNLQDEALAREYAIGAIHAELDVFCRRWHDAKENEKIQKEAIDTCFLPPYSTIQAANHTSKQSDVIAGIPVSSDPTSFSDIDRIPFSCYNRIAEPDKGNIGGRACRWQ